MSNIEERWGEVVKNNNWKEAVTIWQDYDMYGGSEIYSILLEKDPILGKKALEVVLDHIEESEMYYHFPEYIEVMLSAGIDKARLIEMADKTVDWALGEEDCDIIKSIADFLENSLEDKDRAEDYRNNAKANCCPESEYDWDW